MGRIRFESLRFKFRIQIIQTIIQMATEQVLQWMNRDLKLSQPVHSFETDFANGYLFGEILVQYGVYSDISIFSKKTNKEAKVNNFYKIEEALRSLKVRFDAKLTHNIMQEERGAALRLLYQLKLAIQKMEGPAPDEAEAMTTTGLKSGTVKRLLAGRREMTMNAAHTIKPVTVGGKDIRTEKTKRQDLHLAPFALAQTKLFEDAQAKDQAEKALVASIQQRKRSDQRTKLAENQAFMREWEEEGQANWKINQQKRQQAIQKIKYFEDREVNIYKTKLNNELIGATKEMQHGFSEFEKNLQKLGIEQNTNMEDAIKRQEEKKGIPPGQIQNFSFPATMNKIKETKKQSDFAGKERERRRRKLAVDQATTQAKLDKQKQEDLLVEKLLKREQDEMKQAYLDARTRKCKAMQVENRSLKANATSQKREAQMKEIEEARIAEVKANEGERAAQIELQRQQYVAVRKEQKIAKRQVNIEICSGLVDLLMDVAEETFAAQQQAPNRKLEKHQWREFMSIFKAGKKVSLRNVTKNVAQMESAATQEGMLAITGKEPITELLRNFKTEPALGDLQQYLSGSGMFNLCQIKPHLWAKIQKELKTEQFAPDGSYRMNPQLGQFIEQLYSEEALQTKKSIISVQNQNETIDKRSATEEMVKGSDIRGSEIKGSQLLAGSERAKDSALSFPQPKMAGIPTGLQIKLSILGRAFSGKRTLAKMLQEKIGEKNITVFDMDSVISEALEYVTPKKQEEAVVDAKGKKAAGGKAATKSVEDINTIQDKFEGKATEDYRAVALKIKQQYFNDYEGELTQKKDLVTLVPDDNLLVSLFIERLKLEYAGVDLTLDMAEIEAGVKREQEIEASLTEMDSIERKSADLNAAKGKDKKSSKTADKKTPEEQLQEELETIRGIKLRGWVLLDFPKNLTQMKLLEQGLSDYENPADRPKEDAEVIREAWTKIASPAHLEDEVVIGETQATPSGLDGVVILDTPVEECLRRAGNRKVDPQTNIVYHLDDNPPNDPKIEERLQDYTDEEGGQERIQKTSSRFDENVDSIRRWCQNFGLQSEDAVFCEVPLDMNIRREDWKGKNEVFESVEEYIDRIIAFRQSEYQQIRSQVRKQLSTLQPVVDDQQLAGGATIEGEMDPEEVAQEEEGEHEAAPSGEEAKKQLESSRVIGTVESKKLMSDGPASISHGGTSRSFAKSQLLQRVSEISEIQKKIKWEEMLSLYYGEGIQQFNMMRNLRQNVFKSLNDMQRQFINYLSRRNDMQKKLNEFCESYNRFSNEFPELLENEETKQELQNRIDILSQQLWEQIKARKDESFNERKNRMEGGWVQVEMANVCSHVGKLIENEYVRLATISAIVTGVFINEPIDLQELIKRLVERGTDSYVGSEDEGSLGTSPVLFDVTSLVLQKVEGLFNEQFVLGLEKMVLDVLITERENFSMRVNTLYTWAILILDEIQQQANRVFDVLDDWIVIAVKKENKACQEAVQEISKSISNEERTMDSVILGDIDLMGTISQIEFEEGPPLYMSDIRGSQVSFETRFELPSICSLYKQMQKNKSDNYLIDAESFVTLLIVNIQAGMMPNMWRYVSFDSIKTLLLKFKAAPMADTLASAGQVALFRRHSSYSMTAREFVDWRKVFSFLLLNATPYPTKAQKDEYFEQLKEHTDPVTGLISLKTFLKIETWFDKYEGVTVARTLSQGMTASVQASISEDEEEEDSKRASQIKELLFKTYRVPNQQDVCTGELIADLGELFAEGLETPNGEPVTALYQTLL